MSSFWGLRRNDLYERSLAQPHASNRAPGEHEGASPHLETYLEHNSTSWGSNLSAWFCLVIDFEVTYAMHLRRTELMDECHKRHRLSSRIKHITPCLLCANCSKMLNEMFWKVGSSGTSSFQGSTRIGVGFVEKPQVKISPVDTGFLKHGGTPPPGLKLYVTIPNGLPKLFAFTDSVATSLVDKTEIEH